LMTIPRNAVKRVMKIDDEVKQVQQEAVVLVGKATELFLAKLAGKAFDHASKEERRQIKYDDLYNARLEDPNMLFLKRE
jgi:histone H3/H4